ncbi:bifunctional folylpolyglutamate synthase/dihydrofolate synthase [Chloroflexota bacterium]
MNADYQKAIDYLSSYTDYEVVPRLAHNAANYDLRRVEELLARLGNPHLKVQSVHIAGTNGKGSTAAMVTSALIASGYITGLYTSPHLNTWRERIRVNGELISEDEFVSVVEKLKPEIEVVNDKATYGRLTTFEILTTMAYVYFAMKKADFQVLEVGMGGKFDATNVIYPEVSVITSISFDHKEVLGDTLSQIAAEKAGIIKPDSVVVMSPQVDEAYRVILETCNNLNSKLIRVGTEVTWENQGVNDSGQKLIVLGRLDNYPLSIPLLGSHQLENAATAVATLEVLQEKGFKVSRDSIIEGLSEVDWPGRMQIIGRKPIVVVDGAHNPDGADKLQQYIKQNLHYKRAILVIGMSCDKDITGIISPLAPIFNKVIATNSHHPRVAAPATIAAEFAKHSVKAQVSDGVANALSQAIEMAEEQDLICVAGSLFVVAEAIEQAKSLRLLTE